MNASTRLAAVVFGLLASTSLRAADPTDPAELFPPGTLAYVELHDPATAGPQIAAAFKGSQLEDSIAYIHQRREKSKDPRDHFSKDQLAVLGLIASPEMAAEFKRLRGLAVAVVGLNEQRDPEYAAVVLTGESSAAGLAARAFLTLTSLRKVATVGDVPVYQFKRPGMAYDPNGRQILQNDKPPPEGAYEPTFAYLPGLFVAGSSKKAIGEVIARFQGKTKGSLADSAGFKESVASHRKSGLFFYANVPEFLTKLDEAKKKTDAVGMDVEPDSLGWFKVLMNAKALRTLSGRLTFHDGGLALSLGGRFEPGQKSPLFDLLAGPGANIQLLRHAPSPSTFAFSVSFPEQNRAAAILGFLDGLAKSNGSLGRTPSEAAKELEAKFNLPISSKLLARTKAATVVLPVKQDLPKGALALPLVVLHTESPEDASAWEEFLPKLLGDMAGGDAPQPATETIDGLKVITLPGGTMPWKSAIHCARKDAAIAIGQDRKLVAAAAKGEAAAPTLLLPVGDSALVGSLGAGGLVRVLTDVKPPEGPVVPRGPATPAKIQPNFGRFGGFGGDIEEAPGLPDGSNMPEAQKKSEAAAKEAVFKALDSLPPASITMKRAGSNLRIEVFQPKAQGAAVAPLVNAGVGWFDLLLNRYANPNAGYDPYGRFRGGW